jgi:hypothetical protein
MKTVGRLKGTVWERFDRLQRTAALLLGDRNRHPVGVFRFKSHEEADQWNQSLNQRLAARPTKTTS